jgi:hypothetical protein
MTATGRDDEFTDFLLEFETSTEFESLAPKEERSALI